MYLVSQSPQSLHNSLAGLRVVPLASPLDLWCGLTVDIFANNSWFSKIVSYSNDRLVYSQKTKLLENREALDLFEL